MVLRGSGEVFRRRRSASSTWAASCDSRRQAPFGRLEPGFRSELLHHAGGVEQTDRRQVPGGSLQLRGLGADAVGVARGHGRPDGAHTGRTLVEKTPDDVGQQPFVAAELFEGGGALEARAGSRRRRAPRLRPRSRAVAGRAAWSGSRPCRRARQRSRSPVIACAVIATMRTWPPVSRSRCADRGGRFEAVHLRHLHVHQHEVERARARARRRASRPLLDHRHVVAAPASSRPRATRWLTMLSSASSTLAARTGAGGAIGRAPARDLGARSRSSVRAVGRAATERHGEVERAAGARRRSRPRCVRPSAAPASTRSPGRGRCRRTGASSSRRPG